MERESVKMIQNSASWLHETASLLLGYLAVGASFIPAGLLYAGLRLLGWQSPLTAIIPLALGFLLAHRVWNWLERGKLHGAPDIKAGSADSVGAIVTAGFKQWLGR